MKTIKKRTILIIDDSEVDIAALTDILSLEYELVIARCGTKGVELAKSIRPDLIILDVVMPDIDGYEAISLLKKAVSTRNIPVIFITSLSKTKDEKKGLRLGCADYITKPFSKELVKLRIQNQTRILDYINKIEELSRIDQLTGLPNRRSFHERLRSEWKLAIREGTSVSILVMDVDHFKKCNDTYGHLMGDTVLQKVANSIASCLKRPTDFAARWGGEEFIALLPKTELNEAQYVAEEIRKNIENLIITFKDGKTTNITISIGVATEKPIKKSSLNNFMQHADGALYEAKKSGRNNVTIYQTSL